MLTLAGWAISCSMLTNLSYWRELTLMQLLVRRLQWIFPAGHLDDATKAVWRYSCFSSVVCLYIGAQLQKGHMG